MKYTMLKYKFIIALFCITGLSLSGCINDFLDECYYLRVKIVNAKGEDLTGSIATSLYIYDESGKYLETKSFTAEELRGYPAVKLDYPANKKLQIVSWSDTENTSLLLTRGDKIENLLLKVQSEADGQAITPDQTYLGNIDVTATSAGGITKNDTIVLRPQIGEIYIYTIGLQYALRNRVGLKSTLEPDCDYRVDNARDTYNYKGERIGSDIYYNPDTEWRSGELYSPGSAVSSGDTLAIALNVNKDVLDIQTKDDNGDYFIPVPGKQVVVVFEYGESGALISVRQAIRDWGTVDDDIIL